jgi:hypothetical protein
MSILSIIRFTVCQFVNNVFAFFFIRRKPASQEILEKEDPENGKHNKKLDKDDDPEFPAPGHATEAFVV